MGKMQGVEKASPTPPKEGLSLPLGGEVGGGFRMPKTTQQMAHYDTPSSFYSNPLLNPCSFQNSMARGNVANMLLRDLMES